MREKPATDLVDVPAAQGLSELTELLPGEKLGRYELETRIGEGAFAEVWRAVEIGTHGFRKRVALKILKPDGDDPESLDALLDEARLCGHLHHPGLVDVYGVTTDRGHTFVAMEWVDGISLDKLLDRFLQLDLRVPPSAVIDLGIQICKALDHAHNATDHDGHALELIHRDLKPGNILLTWNGHAKITDWGIAKARTSNRSTQSGMLRGTPSYVAPEVWLGHRDFKPANDLFAVGAILWEMAAGEILLQGDIPVLIGLATNGSVEEDIQRLRLFSPELCPAVRGLLQRDPQNRTATAAETARLLEAAVRQVPSGGGLPAMMQLAAPIVGHGVGQSGLSGRGMELVEGGGHAWTALLECAGLHGLDLDADETLVSASFDPVSPADLVGQTRKLGTAPPPVPPEPPSKPLTVRPSLLGAGIAAVLFGFILAFSQWANGVGRGAPPADPPPVASAAPSAPAAEPKVEVVPEPPPEPVPGDQPEADASDKPTRISRADITPAPLAEPRPRTPAPPRPKATAPAPPPAAASAAGCMVLQSSPPGAAVFLDGGSTGVHAGTGSTAKLDAPSGAHTIGMGIGDSPQVSTSVNLKGGQKVTVWCDLLGGAGCRVTAGGSCS
ncbi:MAG: serine/threonine protein kinase [Proteobacteria bacterium]|nr:serine/threonine protein kinase [Pseudomonadota bacterium]